MIGSIGKVLGHDVTYQELGSQSSSYELRVGRLTQLKLFSMAVVLFIFPDCISLAALSSFFR
jgi:hypothetical protein